MPTIIGIPPHDIMQGMPVAIMAFMALQRSVIISMPAESMGISFMTMPSLPISMVHLHIIGIIMGIIIGMPIMLIMGFIMGFIPIPIMFIIIGFIMPIIGFIPIMGIGIMFMFGIIGIPWFIGIAFMRPSYGRAALAQVLVGHAHPIPPSVRMLVSPAG